MKRYVIIWSATALNQLDEIYEYISQDSEKAAWNVITRIFNSTKRLTIFPSGSEEETLKELNRGYRFVVSGNYKVVYRLEGKAVIIAAVFDTRQDPERLKGMVES
jgi:addiction module RelE/StbE family toxin